VILGSTGSIGLSALKVVDQFAARFRIAGLVAGRNLNLLAEQARRYRPDFVAIADPALLPALKAALADLPTSVVAGEGGICGAVAEAEADLAVSAIVGFAGVRPTLSAIEAGSDVALANKEALVAAGPLLIEAVRRRGVRLLPIDSEPSAIFQVLEGRGADSVKRLVLTASGGPFLNLDPKRMNQVTPGQALRHPRWAMGNKISIDSATMMNKALEVIEASRLFDIGAERIDVVIHPESIVHSMVEFVDGSLIAQLSVTDMRGAIAYAMSYPQRLEGVLPSLALGKVGNLTFSEPDHGRFPCLRLGMHAARLGGSVPAVLNAANEVAVHAFLDGKIGFPDIHAVVGAVMELHDRREFGSMEELEEIDAWARTAAGERIRALR
jgi:1-deoxy-D-xylulose-5-phosphate reductoisomerase